LRWRALLAEKRDHTLMSQDSFKNQVQETSPAPSTEAQFQRLIDVISRSQHNFRDLIDSLDHAVFNLSLDGSIRVANRRLAEILGVSFQDLIGHSLAEFIAEPARPQLEQALSRLLLQGTWAGRAPVRLKNGGDPRYFDCWFQTIREDARENSISGWARDVTAPYESEMRFTELFESLREGILFTTPEGKVLDANPALVRMLGFESKEDLQSHDFSEVYVDPSQRAALVQDLLRKGSLQDHELHLRRKDGTQIYCLASGFAIRDSFGNVTRLQGTLVDVTERRQIERRLQQEQEFVRRLVASFPDPIAVLDREGRFTYVSPRIQDVLGYSPEELLNEPLGARTHPDDRPEMMEKFKDVLGGRASYVQLEYRTRHADASWRILRASAGPLFDAEGKITGLVASARDVTESRHVEQQLAQREKFTAMGQMMAGAAHELNNPLTAILGVSDLLRERTADDVVRRQVELIWQQARRAAGIVQNLLAFARPPATSRSKLQLEQILRQALESQQDSLRKKNIAVEFRATENLPPVDGDSRLLAQVFSNLITNAEQAISAVHNQGTLKISLSRAGGRACVVIADSGPGIPPEILGKIFDPFFTTKRPGGGTGLGLTISLAVIKEHGGRLEVQSSPNSGTTVQVLLPIAVEESPAAPDSVDAPRKAPAGSDTLRGRSVLIVDDEDSIREIVQEGLSARGMQVEGAVSSEEALSRLADTSFDIVLCDFNLPGLTGGQLFEQLQGRLGSSAPRFVFMTGDLLDPATIAEFSEKGAWVLQKPFHVSALASLLCEILQPQPAKTN
jgi:PAS domain S-box-containing protein